MRRLQSGFVLHVWRLAAPALLVVITATIATALGDAVLKRVVTAGLITAILVVGLYIFVGNSGVFSFGHMTFMAIGAYTVGLLTIPESAAGITSTQLPGFLAGAHLPAVPATIVAGGVACVVGLAISIPLAGLAGIAASLAMFSFLVITYVVAGNWQSVTGGTAGMAGVPTTTTQTSALLWLLGVMCLAYFFQQSRLGLRLRASREDEVAARSVGIGIANERRVALGLSAFVVGIGGALFAQFVGSINPDAFYLDITFLTIAMLVIGGVNSLAGAILGSVVIVALSELLRRLEQGVDLGSLHISGRLGLQQVALAGMMLAVLLFRPNGLTGGKEITWPFRLRAARGA